MKEQEDRQQEQTGEIKKKRSISIPLLLLVLFGLFSSVVAGILIGRSMDPYQGKIIDTIVIDPDYQRNVHISGQVLYTNGVPYVRGNVELHSTVRESVTDSTGRFFFESVEVGEHSLTVKNQDGSTAAQCLVTVERQKEGAAVQIQKQDENRYRVGISVNVRFIELAVQVDPENKILEFLEEKTFVIEDNGTVHINGKSMDVARGAVVFPSGTVVLPDRTVISAGKMVLPDNSVQKIPEEGYIGANQERIDSTGNVTFPDGTRITESGIVLPDGRVILPEEAYQIGSEEEKAESSISKVAPNSSAFNSEPQVPSGTSSQEESSTQETSWEESSREESSAQESSQEESSTQESSQEESSTQESSREESSTQESSREESSAQESSREESSREESSAQESSQEESSEPEDPDPGKLQISESHAQGWTPWESDNIIDLFYNRTGTAENNNIQPGAHGFYLFRMENSRQTSLWFRISISEDSFHLPLRMRLIDDQGGKTEWQTVHGDQSVQLVTGIIEKSVTYRLEWEWPYESGNDQADTSAGIGKDRAYRIRLNIYAQ